MKPVVRAILPPNKVEKDRKKETDKRKCRKGSGRSRRSLEEAMLEHGTPAYRRDDE